MENLRQIECSDFSAKIRMTRVVLRNKNSNTSSQNVIEDSITLLEYVMEKFPNTRPIVFSHSLGTGPTSAVAKVSFVPEVYCNIITQLTARFACNPVRSTSSQTLGENV